MKWQTYHTRQSGETDCGPACIRTVLLRHGITVDIAILRDSTGPANTARVFSDSVKHSRDTASTANCCDWTLPSWHRPCAWPAREQ